MAFQWPIDKLTLINAALSQTGDNLVDAADNGSDEWNIASPAYEDALPAMIEGHSWYWGTDVRTLPPAGNVPDDDQFDTAYNLPSDLVHLIFVRLDDRPCVWGLLNNQLVLNAMGTTLPAPGVTPGVVTIKGCFAINSDPTFATPLFVSALKRFVMSGIYRGLHEDTVEAAKMTGEAMSILAMAKSRHDQQLPKRSFFNSRIRAARRIRRPWPPVPGGWSGTGSPG